MRILEQTADTLVIETGPDMRDRLIFAAPFLGSVGAMASFVIWGWSFLGVTLVLCVPIALLFLINYKSFFGITHTYSLDRSKNEFLIREQDGTKTKQLRSTISELKSLETETLGTEPSRFYIVVKCETLPSSRLEVQDLFSDDDTAIKAILSFLGLTARA